MGWIWETNAFFQVMNVWSQEKLSRMLNMFFRIYSTLSPLILSIFGSNRIDSNINILRKWHIKYESCYKYCHMFSVNQSVTMFAFVLNRAYYSDYLVLMRAQLVKHLDNLLTLNLMKVRFDSYFHYIHSMHSCTGRILRIIRSCFTTTLLSTNISVVGIPIPMWSRYLLYIFNKNNFCISLPYKSLAKLFLFISN